MAEIKKRRGGRPRLAPVEETALTRNLARLLQEKDRTANSVAVNMRTPDGGRFAASIVSQILRGISKNPGYVTLRALADELGVPVSALTGVQEDDAPPVPNPTSPLVSQPPQLVQDQTEIDLIAFWRAMSVDERRFMLRLIRGSMLGR